MIHQKGASVNVFAGQNLKASIVINVTAENNFKQSNVYCLFYFLFKDILQLNFGFNHVHMLIK